MPSLHQLFSYVCGQVNLCYVGGVQLPSCQRCTGLYVGGFFALGLVAIFRPKPTPAMLWFHGLLMLFIIPFGYHWIRTGELVRLATGLMFGTGLAYYLVLNPIDALQGWSDDQRDSRKYFAGLLVVVILFFALIRSGSSAIASILGWFAALGFLALSVLAITTVTLTCFRIVHSLRNTLEHKSA
jgi:uncharacterized membrane protein